MTKDPAARALGRKMAFHRSRRGLSQRDFGAMIDRSETWVSQVERGVRRIDRMTVLRQVAEALDVPLSELAADTPTVSELSSHPEPASQLRMLLSSSLSFSLAVTSPEVRVTREELEARALQAWELAHEARFGDLVPLLAELIPAGEAAIRAWRGAARRSAFRSLARIYHAAAAVLSKLNEVGAAWIAADRAIAAAERADDMLLMAEGAFRLTLVFQTARLYEQAENTAATAIDALRESVERGSTPAVSLVGALHLQRAVIAARQNSADAALTHLSSARDAAETLGTDRNDYHTEFGPTNVRMHEVHVAVELGDAGAALRIAAGIDRKVLSPERNSRLSIDIARAKFQRRDSDGAVVALLEAERVAPEQMRNHWMVRNLLHDLHRSTHARDIRVRAMIERSRLIV